MPARITTLSRQIFSRRQETIGPHPQPWDVFINHRCIDTQRNVAGLLYHHLRHLRLRPFLDIESMKPGDRILDKVEKAIGECKVGVAIFSPMYCESYFCLHELSLMMEAGKKVVPVFCDVKPSELQVKDDRTWCCSPENLHKFHLSIEESKDTVGVMFDTLKGDWSEFLASATDAVIKNLTEVEENLI